MLLRAFVLFLACFAAIGAIAQPSPAPTAFVDSRDDCAALGGAWQPGRASWQSNCQVPWAKDECLRLHGAWSAIPLAPNGGACMAQLSQKAAAGQCTSAGGTWGPAGSPMPFCQPSTKVAVTPVRTASDANKACSSQGDCIYGCVYKGPSVAANTPVQGHCRATNHITGCDEVVEHGRVAGNICKK